MPHERHTESDINPAMTFADPPPPLSEATADTIRARAFELYEARGGAPGHDLDDWLQAEGELRAARDIVHV